MSHVTNSPSHSLADLNFAQRIFRNTLYRQKLYSLGIHINKIVEMDSLMVQILNSGQYQGLAASETCHVQSYMLKEDVDKSSCLTHISLLG